jgi:hypothetical protein
VVIAMLSQVTAFLKTARVRVLAKVKAQILAEVPADMAACEFDCREVDCVAKDWESCSHRQQKAEAIKQQSEIW